MSVDVVMPQMGESITEGTVSKWLKNEGDRIEKDEPILEISTDKVDAEVPSPGAGILLKINTPEGETVDVGSVLAVIGETGEEPTPAGDAKTPGRGDAETAVRASVPPAVAGGSDSDEAAPSAPPTPAPSNDQPATNAGGTPVVMPQMRSEEHTSELQS